MDLKQHIRSIPDFPKPGILFYDISTLLAHPSAWRTTIEQLVEAVRPHRPDLLLGIESRGFLVAAPLAYSMQRGFVMVRKRGKLPGATIPLTYDLEYGSDTIEIIANTSYEAPGLEAAAAAMPADVLVQNPVTVSKREVDLLLVGEQRRKSHRTAMTLGILCGGLIGAALMAGLLFLLW